MRTRNHSVLLAAGAALLALAPRAARAQADTNPPLPNALLLVDTSGSMEYMAAPDASGKPVLPVCNPGSPLLKNDQNRWTTLVDVLGGEVQNFSCSPTDRGTPNFKTEFGLGPNNPVDWNYYLKNNRIVSNGCVMGPNQVAWPPVTPGGIFDFPANSFTSHSYSTLAAPCAGFLQASDGLLDSFSDRVRFGLMTFDNSPTAGKGFTGAQAPDFPSGIDGEWSYFPGWWPGPGTPALGMPGGCSTSQVLEVGARNPAAPPWEGRAIGFGDPNASTAQITTVNTQIQQALLAVRPYGATPIAGLLSDAQYFLTAEAATLPGQTTPFGPKDDPFVKGLCRKNFIILLTDGTPNMDLRPSCAANATPPAGCPWEPGGTCPTGSCPYKLPEEIAYDLNHPVGGQNPIPTFVVGFAVSNVNGGAINCSGLTPVQTDPVTGLPIPDPVTGLPIPTAGFDPTGKCVAPATDDLKACCTLGRIAFNGGTSNPFFADNKDALRQALSAILSNISQTATTRTWPTFGIASGSGSAGPGGAAGYGFFSSFKVASGSLWQGVLERRRWLCVQDPSTLAYTATENPVKNVEGDSFQINVSAADASHPRWFYTVVPPASASGVDMRQTIRGVAPGATVYNGSPPTISGDGLGVSGGTQVEGDASTFVGLVPDTALQVNMTAPANSTCSTPATNYSSSQCRDLVMRFNLGVPDATTSYKRTSLFGSIYHSTPTLVSAPNDLLRDESYINFQVAQKLRPTVLYTATTDGQLHAFKVGPVNGADTFKVDSNQQNNELWSFFPPGVVPGLRTLYPGVQQNLLDGVPIVRDVILKRTPGQAIAGGGVGAAAWSTVLTAGFGPGFSGYFALDVTNPLRVAGDPKTGPKFLWQVSRDLGGKPLFGASTTPAIATVLYNDGSGPAEVAIAILPGGDSAPSAPGNCAVTTPSSSIIIDGASSFSARGQIGCYAPDDPAKSVTVVRLDTGEVIRRFADPTGFSPLNGVLLGLTTNTKLDSPMVGVPIPFPNNPGTLASRAFIGDRDGRMWRLDMTSPFANQWKMELFADAFPTALGAFPGQPVVIPPALSVDQVGNPIVYFATGSQDNFSGSDPRNALWAVTERADLASGKLVGTPQWHLGFGETVVGAGISATWNNGTRVTGPLSVFNGAVYFATYKPPVQGANAPVCALSDSTVWGVNYLATTSAGSFTPAAALITPATPVPGVHGIVQSAQLVFGIGVQQAPPCFDTTNNSLDSFVGYGTQSSLPSNVSSGDFRLVWQTSPTNKAMAGNQLTSTNTVTLPPPPSGVRVSSWASIVE